MSGDHATDIFDELNREAVVEAELLAHSRAKFFRRILANHAVDRITDKTEQREGNESHGQHDHGPLNKPSEDEGDHDAKAIQTVRWVRV